MDERYHKRIRNIRIIRREDKVHFVMCPGFGLHKNILDLLSSETLIYVGGNGYQTIGNIKKKNISAGDCLIVRYDTLKKSIEKLND